jgi:photosystem II stability/assembly factor-like uncharacterized protein
MNEHRDGPVHADEDALLRRWYAASSESKPLPPTELLARSGPGHRGRRTFRGLAITAAAIVAIVAGIAGAGAWASFRSASGSSSSPSAVASTGGTPSPAPTDPTPPPSPVPTSQGALGPSLAVHESIVQMHRTAGGGWLLTGSRLLMTDGSNWRDCWESSSGDVVAPYPSAFVAADAIRIIAGTTLWTSTDGCASWTQRPAPIAATGLAFPADQVGYIAYADLSASNQEAQIYRTDDGGQHWTATPGKVKAIADPYGTGFAGSLTLTFDDPTHGWLTDTHTLWTTANGGLTWTRTTLPVPGTVQGQLDLIATPVVGADGTAAVAAKYDSTPGMDGAHGQRVFYRTVDLGAHWTATSIVKDPGMLEISLVDATTWVALDRSEPPTLRVTTDAGSTWRTIAVRERWPFNSGPIDFADSLHGWMAVSEPEPPCPGFSGIQPGRIAICDYAYAPPQHLVATDDGGATWVELKP